MKKILNISFWLFFIVGTLVLLSFTQSKKRNTVCTSVNVEIDSFNGNHFVTPKRVEDILQRIGFKNGEDKFSDIDSKKLEKKLISLSSVEEVEVFKNINGTLEIEVKQRKPIARIFNRNGYSLYLDDKGKTMQISDFYTARVPIINGFVNIKSGEELAHLVNDSLRDASLLDELYELASYLQKDEFLKAQIEQIYVQRNGEVILIPKVGNQEIVFGKVEEIKTKFDKLLLFYKKGINPNNLNLYKTINLKFDNQIVCKKNK
jgi:cell division protein FtsQ